MSTPIPVGVGNSFQNVIPGQATGKFYAAEGVNVIAFQAVDANNPGIVSLYECASDGTATNDAVILTMNREGYETFQAPPGGRYYFVATLGANMLAAIVPSGGGDWR